MENIQINITTILAILGGLTVLFNGVNVLLRLFKPALNFRKSIEEHEQMLNEIMEKYETMQNDNKMTLKCLQALLEYGEEGDSGTIKKTRELLNQFLIDR